MTGVPDPFADGLPTLDGVARDGGTPRVHLRPTRLPDEDGGADAEALFAALSDADTLRYWNHEPYTSIGQAHDTLAGMRRGWQSRTLFKWAIAETASDRLVGTVTLLAWDRTHRRAEIGFLLGRDHWGRGLASEAVRAALAFGFGAMRLHRVEADVDPDNSASLALLARLGFREEGRLAERWFTYGAWRDTVLLGLLATDYGADPSGGQSPSARRSETT